MIKTGFIFNEINSVSFMLSKIIKINKQKCSTKQGTLILVFCVKNIKSVFP